MNTVSYRLKSKAQLDKTVRAWYAYSSESPDASLFRLELRDGIAQGATPLDSYCHHRLETLRNFLLLKPNVFSEIHGLDLLEDAILRHTARNPRKGGCVYCILERMRSDSPTKA